VSAPGQRLSELTTLRLGGPARAVVAPSSEAELVATVTVLDRAGEPVLLVGGGSNLVVADDGFPGTVVRLVTRGVTREGRAGDVLLTAAAGEPWDGLVAACVADGLAGVEALSGIPGLAGATPLQNVGAYGQEVADTVTEVRVLDRTTGQVGTLDAASCGFGYRTSVLRGSGRYLVLAVTMRLRTGGLSTPVRYPELARALGVEVGHQAPVQAVRDVVLALRRAKGMVVDATAAATEGATTTPTDPDTVSAGSFFTNPVLDALAAERLPTGAPRYPATGGRVKTSAAWLIEQAGFARGYGHGPARISSKHTLALTNTGGATTSELLDLAREIRAGVAARFGVVLEPEPVLVGCTL
jgi:UDP-N-acetylmuramate dehydrogenase